MKRLDQLLVEKGLAPTRSQAENYIKLGFVQVDGRQITKSGFITDENSRIELKLAQQYVSRAGLKLDSVAKKFGLDFKDKLILDAGSSTGGFTDYALRQGARQVIAVEVGTAQMNPLIANNPRVELHEKTDIRDFQPLELPDIILADLSFISLRQILPFLAKISGSETDIIALLKPQFEAGKTQINRGIVKNDKLRRQIIKDFENWVQKLFKVVDKQDSEIAGSKGNLERFYYLKPLK